MRAALFWVVTQRVVVIPFRRFGTTYRSRIQQGFTKFEDDTDRLSRNVGKKLNTARCVIAQNSAVLSPNTWQVLVVFLSAFIKILGWYLYVAALSYAGFWFNIVQLTVCCASARLQGRRRAKKTPESNAPHRCPFAVARTLIGSDKLRHCGDSRRLVDWHLWVRFRGMQQQTGRIRVGGGVLQALWSRAHHSRDLFALPQYLPQW